VWEKGALKSGGWGKVWIRYSAPEKNPSLLNGQKRVKAAIYDGRFIISFTVMWVTITIGTTGAFITKIIQSHARHSEEEAGFGEARDINKGDRW